NQYSNQYGNQYGSKWELQLFQLSSASNIKQLPLKTLLVQLELAGVIEPTHAYFADFKIKLLQPINKIMAGFNEQRQHFLSAIFRATQFKKVWGSLSFDHLLQDQSIERNRVIAALEYLQEQQMIILETSRMTEVFKVNVHELNDPSLAKNLYDYFIDKEEKEIKRIAALVRFFQLDSCLSFNLARYFDDPLLQGSSYQDGDGNAVAAQQCGHCSVCRGDVAKLECSLQAQWPTNEELITNAVKLQQHLSGKMAEKMATKTPQPLSLETYCRFFAGMTVPIFGRHKVKQLTGFSSCEQLRYQDIRDKLTLLNIH
ncbi:MAG: recombinase RecQ, partial [Colwellia sp.]|nr:recombinase RecQ [Colwellia sp.]